MFIVMKRITKQGHERYYKIMVFLNIIGEIIMYREYGNSSYKRHTGSLEKPFSIKEEAEKEAFKIQKMKEKKGYIVAFSSKSKTMAKQGHKND
jgi:predicted DNA-binding WGR domain protein